MELISLYPNSSKTGNRGREEEGSRDKENKTVLWLEPEGLHVSSLKGVILSEQPKNCFPLHYAVLTQGSEDTMPEQHRYQPFLPSAPQWEYQMKSDQSAK